MVRRITIDEAAANFKAIVEAALENGDAVELERNGRVIGTFSPPLPETNGRVSLGQFLRELYEKIPDEDFARDVQWAIDNQGTVDFSDPWEKDGNDYGPQRADPDGETARRGPDDAT